MWTTTRMTGRLLAYLFMPLTVALFLTAPCQADWEPSLFGSMPPDAIVGGQISGIPVYLCRAYHESDMQPGWAVKGESVCHFSYGGVEQTSMFFDWWVPSWRTVTGPVLPSAMIPFRGENNNWRFPCRVGGTPGKYGADLGGCLYPYGGVEQHQSGSGFSVLVDADGGDLYQYLGEERLAPTSQMGTGDGVGPFAAAYVGPYEGTNVPMPADAIVGGTDADGQLLYLCASDVSMAIDLSRGPESNQPGKARADWNACDVSYGGLENYRSSFFVLEPNWRFVVMDPDDPVPCIVNGGEVCGVIPESMHLVPAGTDTNGEPLYACQVWQYPGTDKYPGKIGASFTGGCSYALNGIEYYAYAFYVLVDGAPYN
jgi:hypothetical protein